MASLYIGANRGADLQPGSVTVDNASGGTDVELRIDTGKNLTRHEVKQIVVEGLIRYLLDGRTATFPL